MTKRWNERDLAYYNAQRRLMTELAKAPHKPVEFTTGRSYTFIVAGEGEPGGSKKAFVPLQKDKICTCGPTPVKMPFRREGGGIMVNVVDANDNAEHWKKHIGKVARNEYSGPVFTGALSVTFHFFRPRPQSHYTSTGRLSKEGLETPFPITRPDALKLARAAEDALTTIAWSDDSIIVREILEKDWGWPARMEVTIEEIIVPEPYEQPALFEAPAPWETTEGAAPQQQTGDHTQDQAGDAPKKRATSDAGKSRTARNRAPDQSDEPPPWEAQDQVKPEKKDGNSQGR